MIDITFTTEDWSWQYFNAVIHIERDKDKGGPYHHFIDLNLLYHPDLGFNFGWSENRIDIWDKEIPIPKLRVPSIP